MKKTLKIATRKSPLALWQANFVKQQLTTCFPNLTIELVSMTTSGDNFLQDSLAKVGGKGLFTKELEVALLNKQADLAVHSMKDLPVTIPGDFTIAAVLKRVAVNDVLISRQYSSLSAMPAKAVIGTSSLRRISQLQHQFKHLSFKPVRGNVNTRLAKLDDKQFDGLILAQAGVDRLGFSDQISQIISVEQCLPAVGQGILAIECLAGNNDIEQLVQVLHDNETAQAVCAERAMNAALNGGCEVPIAGYANYQQGKLWLRALVGKPDGSLLLQAQATGEPVEAESIGEQAATQLLNQGADRILQEVYHGNE